MKTLVFVVVLLLAGIAVLGFSRGWFHLSTSTGHTSAGQLPSATFSVDKDKIHQDEQTAKDKVEGFEHK
jgi:hypothetical protein